MEDEKDRLEKEIRFLKESLDSNIISSEEYERGKAKIDKKLKSLGVETGSNNEELTVEDINDAANEESTEDLLKEVDEASKSFEKGQRLYTSDDILNESYDNDNLGKTKEIKDKQDERDRSFVDEERPFEPTEDELNINNKDNYEVYDVPEKKDEEKESEPPVKFDKNKLISVAVVIGIIAMFMIIRGIPQSSDSGIVSIPEFKAVCGADEDCYQPGKDGFCIAPGTKEALCEYKDPVPVKLTIINDNSCVGCDTSRTLNVLKQIFPGLKNSEVDISSQAGKTFVQDLGVEVLPAYIFDSKVSESVKFDKFKRALEKNGEYYVVTPTASGANYFFTRQDKPATIEFFVEEGQDTTVLDNSLASVSELFGSNINIKKNVVTESDKKMLIEELAINTFPAYLINNQLKFTGTQAPEVLKNRFCYMNSLSECEQTLSLDIQS